MSSVHSHSRSFRSCHHYTATPAHSVVVTITPPLPLPPVPFRSCQHYTFANRLHFIFLHCFSVESKSLIFFAQARSAAETASTNSPESPAKTTSCNAMFCRIGRPNSRRNAGKPRRLVFKYCERKSECVSILKIILGEYL